MPETREQALEAALTAMLAAHPYDFPLPNWEARADAHNMAAIALATTLKNDHRDARIAQLEEEIRKMLASAVPHPVEHPTMTAAWESAQATLSGSSTDWLEGVKREVTEPLARQLRDAIEKLRGTMARNARLVEVLRDAPLHDVDCATTLHGGACNCAYHAARESVLHDSGDAAWLDQQRREAAAGVWRWMAEHPDQFNEMLMTEVVGGLRAWSLEVAVKNFKARAAEMEGGKG